MSFFEVTRRSICLFSCFCWISSSPSAPLTSSSSRSCSDTAVIPTTARTASLREFIAVMDRSSNFPLNLTVSSSSISSIMIFSPKSMVSESVSTFPAFPSLRYSTVNFNLPVTHTVWLFTFDSSKIILPLVCIILIISGLLSFTMQSSSNVTCVKALLFCIFCFKICFFNSKKNPSLRTSYKNTYSKERENIPVN